MKTLAGIIIVVLAVITLNYGIFVSVARDTFVYGNFALILLAIGCSILFGEKNKATAQQRQIDNLKRELEEMKKQAEPQS